MIRQWELVAGTQLESHSHSGANGANQASNDCFCFTMADDLIMIDYRPRAYCSGHGQGGTFLTGAI